MLEEKQVLRKLKNDFSFFARKCLKIKTKNSEFKSFNLNETQYKVHNFIEKNKYEGKNRFVILKARQFGISTYTEARLFWKTMFNFATNSFIMADSTSSANNIFEMTKRFYDLLPEGMIKPELKKSNEKAIVFDELDSSFRIGTAGNKQVGRSMTINYLHCSEVGFWDNASEIIAGLFQTVPTNKESEIILESTANGVGNFFHDICLAGLEEKSDFKTLFLPWFTNSEYSTKINDPLFTLNDEEKELKALYKLKDEQLFWRRNKLLSDFKGREYLFKQEYPACFNEAFLTTQNALIPSEYIERARKKNILVPDSQPIIFGIDPARNGDRTVIAIRQGRRLKKVVIYDEDMTQTRIAGELIYLLNYWKPRKCFIDVGLGYGIIDILHEKGLRNIVEGVAFNQQPNNRTLYTNKRTEIYGLFRDWIMDENGVQIPDNELIANEIMAIPDFKVNSNGQYQMISKDEIKKMLNGKSTDITDAIALTFAEDVPIEDAYLNFENKVQVKNVRKRL